MNLAAAPAQYVQRLWQPILTAIQAAINACFTKGQDVRLINGERLSLKSPGGTEVFLTVGDDGEITTPIGVLPVTTTATTTFTISGPGLYVLTGSTTTGILPAVANSLGWLLIFKNRGSGTFTTKAPGSDKIYFSSAVSTLDIPSEASSWMINDGTYWDAELVRAVFG